ncbi:hypothetical protein BDZ89DRAFT_171236 [Hymenopellis radicata]|nr:hypothetical protein BDZ89DRAFT_171236 [Hymenopellis radicata]
MGMTTTLTRPDVTWGVHSRAFKLVDLTGWYFPYSKCSSTTLSLHCITNSSIWYFIYTGSDLPSPFDGYLAAHLQVVPQLQCVDLRLDLRFAILSRPSAVELLQHVSTRARNSKLDHFSLLLYTTAKSSTTSSGPPIYDAGPNSPLGAFLSFSAKPTFPN